MARIPTSGRQRSYDEENEPEQPDEDENEPGKNKGKKRRSQATIEQARERLNEHLRNQAAMKITHKSPTTEEEKKETFQKLALLRSYMTYEQCAEAFGVSRATIGKWIADPMYRDACIEIQQDKRQTGFVTAGTMVNDSLAMVYQLMFTDPSGFVRLKCAELLLKMAGMEEPQVNAAADDRREVNAFIDLARARGGASQPNVNVQINLTQTKGEPGEPPSFVTSTAQVQEDQQFFLDQNSLLDPLDQELLGKQQREMMSEYDQPLLPGGKLPGADQRLAEKLKELRELGR